MLTDYAGGARGRALQAPPPPLGTTSSCLNCQASPVARGHWRVQRYSRGSYTAYLPGQLTAIAGLEGQSAGLLKFAGEHADSF